MAAEQKENAPKGMRRSIPLPAFIVAAAAARTAQEAAAAAALAVAMEEEDAEQAQEAAEAAVMPVLDYANIPAQERRFQIREPGGLAAELGAVSYFASSVFKRFVVEGEASPALEQYLVGMLRYVGHLPQDAPIHQYVWRPFAFELFAVGPNESAVYRRVVDAFVRYLPDAFIHPVLREGMLFRATPTGSMRRRLMELTTQRYLRESNDPTFVQATLAVCIGDEHGSMSELSAAQFQEAVETLLWPALQAAWALEESASATVRVTMISIACRRANVQLFPGLRVVLMLDHARFTDLMTRRPDAALVLGIAGSLDVTALLGSVCTAEGEAAFQRFPHVQSNVLWLLARLQPMILAEAFVYVSPNVYLAGPTAVSDFFIQMWLDNIALTLRDRMDDRPGRSMVLSNLLVAAFLAGPSASVRERICARAVPLLMKMKRLRFEKMQQMFQADLRSGAAPPDPTAPVFSINVANFEQIWVWLETNGGPSIELLKPLLGLLAVEFCKDEADWTDQERADIEDNGFSNTPATDHLYWLITSRLEYQRYMNANDNTTQRNQVLTRHRALWATYAESQLYPERGYQWARPPDEPDYPPFNPGPISPDIRPFDLPFQGPGEPAGLSSMEILGDALDQLDDSDPNVNALIAEMYLGHSDAREPRMADIFAARSRQRAAARAAAAQPPARAREEEEEEKEGGNKRSKP